MCSAKRGVCVSGLILGTRTPFFCFGGSKTPYTDSNPPTVSKNWTPEEQHKCVAAANAVLSSGGTEQESIFSCIHAAGKSKAAIELLNMAEDTDWQYDEVIAGEPDGYLEKFNALVLGLGYFTKDQVDSLVKTARGYAGGKSKGKNHVQSLEFDDFAPPKVRGLSDASLILAHKRLHDSFASAEADKTPIGAAHGHVSGEMKRRNMRHFRRDELDGGNDAKSSNA